MADHSSELCPDDKMSRAMKIVERDNNEALLAIEELLGAYARDPRLHFLCGSVLASLKRYAEAERAMQIAIEIAPNYAIARFQLGLLQLTSGEANAALSTWGPLAQLPEDHYLSLFVRGLQHMIRNEFAKAEEHLRAGVAKNAENPPLNRDMLMLVDRMQGAQQAGAQAGDGSLSSAHFLLQQMRSKGPPN